MIQHFSRLLVVSVLLPVWSGLLTIADEPQEPSKGQLIDTLTLAWQAIDEERWQDAEQYFVVPANSDPSMLAALIKNRELSLAGIRILEQEGEFINAIAAFGEQRAQALAERAAVDVRQCYGIVFATEEVTAEIMAVWQSERFKLVRVDDVGKLEPKPQTPQEAILSRLPALAAAVTESPNNVQSRAKYAMALYQVGNYPEAWEQLTAARKLEPNHSGILTGTQVVLHAFQANGLFTVGLPIENVEALLGPPDKVVQVPWGDRRIYAFFAIDSRQGKLHEVIDLRGATEELFRPTEVVSVELDGRGWLCGLRVKSKGSSRALFFLPGESIAQWTESFEVERILKGAEVGSIEQIARIAVTQTTDKYPGTESSVISTSEGTVLLRFDIPQLGENSARIELVRLLKGASDVHRLVYSVRGSELSSEMNARWQEILLAAKLMAPQP